ncbi:conserved hypothetical protein [Histoplasma capsulatum var. duboisii H88]|uniref:Uncharacterized protein n=1 Tax=Ajellomyces capsulatus (strain H88) TaxID=544711 RepID=F0UQR6_AJEC8|nr:conserved hypothetical protein [Histoplasma capsulatum var. duboisii H88]
MDKFVEVMRAITGVLVIDIMQALPVFSIVGGTCSLLSTLRNSKIRLRSCQTLASDDNNTLDAEFPFMLVPANPEHCRTKIYGPLMRRRKFESYINKYPAALTSPVVNYRKAIGDHKTTAVKKLQHIPKQLAMLDDQEPLDQPTIQKEKKIEKIRGATVLHVDSRGKLPDDPSLTTASRDAVIAWRNLVRDRNSAQYNAINLQQSASGNLPRLSRRIFEQGKAHFCAFLLDLRAEWADAGIPHFSLKFRTMKTIEQRLGVSGWRKA